MADPRFFACAGPFSLASLAERLGAAMPPGVPRERLIEDTAALDAAGPNDLTYFAEKRYRDAVAKTRAGACLIKEDAAGLLPDGVVALIVTDPVRAYVRAANLFHPPERPPGTVDPRAIVHPTAKLGADVTVGPGAVIGANVEIGPNTVIGANAVIGAGCAIGTGCNIGPLVSIAYALIGDRVIIHPQASIGQDGFGFAMGPEGHLKIPQLGRVIIQDDVEIGAGTAIDRGAGHDTVIGQGTKIDNLVQIGHNVRIGRGCVLAGQCGISGSTVLGDFVAVGGQAGFASHLTIGSGAQIAATAGVMRDVPPQGVYCGAPARPIRTFMREVATLARLAQEKRSKDE